MVTTCAAGTCFRNPGENRASMSALVTWPKATVAITHVRVSSAVGPSTTGAGVGSVGGGGVVSAGGVGAAGALPPPPHAATAMATRSADENRRVAFIAAVGTTGARRSAAMISPPGYARAMNRPLAPMPIG